MIDRSLATVLFTDIVGSTARAAELGDRRWRELLQAHHGRVRAMLRRYGGREVKTAGDGFLAVFDSPARGIVCAAAIRDALEGLGLSVRSGLHMGAVDRSEGDIGGMAVHVGARVASLAGAGEILVSGAVRDAEVGSGFGFEDKGTHELKGVPGEWRLYRVTTLPEDAASARVTWRERGRRYAIPALALLVLTLMAGWAITSWEGDDVTPEEILAADAAPAIAVLPFRVSGTGVEDLHEGMVDLLSLNLDGAAGLRAIDSRTVLARWEEEVEPGGHPDIAGQLEIARRTGARYAMVGQVIGMGSSLRLSADVYDARSGKRLGHGEAAGHPDSLPFLVDRLTLEALRTTLETEGQPLLRADLTRTMTTSMPALKAYLEGEGLLRRADFEGVMESYRRAVEADSTFALALLRLQLAARWVAEPPPPVLQRAERLLGRYASELPPRQALLLEAHRSILTESTKAIPALQGAVQQYPDDPEIWFTLGALYVIVGHVVHVDRREIERVFERAVELDPAFTPAYYYLLDLAFAADDSARTSRLISTVTRLSPDTPWTRGYRFAYDLVHGDPETRARHAAALDTLPIETLMQVSLLLRPPSRFALLERISEILAARPGFGWPGVIYRAEASYARGKPMDLEHALQTTIVTTPDGTREPYPAQAQGYFLYGAHLAGMGPAPAVIDSLLSEPDIGPLTHFFVGARAVEAGHADEYANAVAGLHDRGDTYDEQGDSTAALFYRGAAEALEGYRLWEQGERSEALTNLQRAVPRLHGLGHRNAFWGRFINYTAQLWTGRALLESGRPREAVGYFEALRTSPDLVYVGPALLHLGEAYEAIGEREKAADAHRALAIAWGDADPRLRPIAARASAEAARLGGLRRE